MDEDRPAPPALPETETARRQHYLLCAEEAAKDEDAARGDFTFALAEVVALRAQLEDIPGERVRLENKENRHRAESVALDIECTPPTHLQFASQRCQALVRKYKTREEGTSIAACGKRRGDESGRSGPSGC